MKNLVLSIILLLTVPAYAYKPLLTQSESGTLYLQGKPYHQGLPSGLHIKDIQFVTDTLYIATSHHGLFKRNLGDSYWTNITPPDAHARSVTGLLPEYRSISALCIDGSDPATIYIATKYTLYRSSDGGKTWYRLSLQGMPANACITAVYADGSTLLIGTSWNGVYRFVGNRFVPFHTGLSRKTYSDTVTFIEEIVKISPRFCITAYTHEVFEYSGNVWQKRFGGSAVKWLGRAVGDTAAVVIANDAVVEVSGQGVRYYELSLVNTRCALVTNGTRYVFVSKIATHTDNVRGIYAGIPLSWNNIKKLVGYAKKARCNALVVDIKDDYGNVYVNDELASSIGAIRSALPLNEVCQYLHAHGMMAIARIVVFKDERLFKAFDSKYAIVDSTTKKPWRGTSKEYWVDPYAEFVHSYNCGIAKKAQEAGFDEIQFDYIRFPTDGPVHRCVFPFKPDNGIYKYEAVTQFLKTAKKALHIPISVDVYGFTAWYEFGQWLGQDIESMTSIADVLCPMVYPSHYGRKFFENGVNPQSYYAIVTESLRRARMQSKATVRPYLQAFCMLSPQWGYEYIHMQRKACTDAEVEGYIFWNAAGEYDVLLKEK